MTRSTAWCAHARPKGRRLKAIVLDQLAADRAAGGGGRGLARARRRRPSASGSRSRSGACWRRARASMKARLYQEAAHAGDARRRGGGAEAPRRPHRRRARAARLAASRPAGASISWPRSSTARPTRCAPRPTTPRRRGPAWSSRPSSTRCASRCRTLSETGDRGRTTRSRASRGAGCCWCCPRLRAPARPRWRGACWRPTRACACRSPSPRASRGPARSTARTTTSSTRPSSSA